MNVTGHTHAALLAPGHPLLDTVVDLIITRHGPLLREGTVLVDNQDSGTEPRLQVAVLQEITDSAQPPRTVSKRFDFVELRPDGTGTSGGEARYLDYDPPEPEELEKALRLTGDDWLSGGVEQLALRWSIEHTLPEHRDRTREQVSATVKHVRGLVKRQLTQQSKWWYAEYLRLTDLEARGERGKYTAEHAERQAYELDERLKVRLHELDCEERLQIKPPVIATAALVVPKGLLDQLPNRTFEPEPYAIDPTETDRRAIAAVMRAERAIGRVPEEMPHNNAGFDIRSRTSNDHWVFIEVKGRVVGADSF